jgi:methylase of polypeptide subunit release factors
MAKKTLDKLQFGDFQTPLDLAQQVVQVLKKNHGIQPDTVIEPTCGKGTFVQAALEEFPNAKVIGFEINPCYVEEALALIPESNCASIQQSDFFLLDWKQVLNQAIGNILILGNPPWVTNSELSSIKSNNLPKKANFQNRFGLEAMTGSANFDLSEWMLLCHIDWLADRNGALAMLCKYSVARKIMRHIREKKAYNLFGHIYMIDAKKYFSVYVNACLFVLTQEGKSADCEVYRDLSSSTPDYVIGERDGYVIRDVNLYAKYRELKGQDQRYIWRSGIKHDCSKVMELELTSKGFKNGFGDIVDIELKYLYPLLKSSDVGNSRIDSCKRYVIVTQSYIGEDTSIIKSVAPKTWEYLESYNKLLNGRKSSIYRGKPLYSIFGVGDYTFKPWKVAISGFYKKLNFCLVGLINQKTVVFDDTVNFLSFDSRNEAEFVKELLLSKPAMEFYAANIFWDEKRPITTNVLRRLSLKAVAQKLDREKEYQYFLAQKTVNHDIQLPLKFGKL